MKDRLVEALKKSDADYTEIRIETEEGSRIAFRGKDLDSAGTSSYCGGIVRACTKGGWGLVAFDSLDDLDYPVQEACRCAALVGKESTELAEVDSVNDERTAVFANDFRNVSISDKLALIQKYNDIVLHANPSVESTGVSYTDRLRTVYFASSRGSYFMEERPRVTCVLQATARDGSLIQRAHKSVGSATTYDVVLGLEAEAKRVGDRAAALLKAPKVDGGPRTVIMDPVMAGVFVHEAFGHLSEADFLYENPKMRELMHVGREVGVKEFNVIDEGAYPDSIGSLSYDDEGTPTGKTYLVKEGVLAGHLHSLETAAKMGVAPTGNARAIGRGKPPLVRMTNTYIENGEFSPEELFSGVDDGIYACGFFGGQTQFEMFTFSAAYGYRIKNGEKAELVRDVTFSGNLFETLKAIDGIGNDLDIHQGSGGCGKGGQSPLPVGLGGPHVRIRDVIVGGK